MSFLKRHNLRDHKMLKGNNLRLHVGSGKDHIKGMINCDVQQIDGVDLVMDCAKFDNVKNECVSHIFGHSFFEHLYDYQQITFLRSCNRILNNKGVLVLLGIPDFDKVAELYYKKAKGIKPFGDTFDLYQAYRLTHGDCEENDLASIPQMHKTLFNKDKLTRLLLGCGFSEHSVFNYCHPNEQYKLTIGVVAWKNRKENKESPKKILSRYKTYIGKL